MTNANQCSQAAAGPVARTSGSALAASATKRRIRNPRRAHRRFACAVLASAGLVLGACDETSTEPVISRSSSDIVAVPFFVVDAEGAGINPQTVDPATPLFDSRGNEPVMAPDGSQLTWSEFSAAQGTVTVECRPAGTYVRLQLSNLIPNGVYTIWNVVFEEPGFTGEIDGRTGEAPNLVGVGPFGPNDGSQSAFVADANGSASFTSTTPEGALGAFGDIGGCALTDEFEWHVVGLYHFDGQTHGSQLGPDGTMAEQFAFIFVR